MLNALNLLCRAATPQSPLPFPTRVLSMAMGIETDDRITDALEDLERHGYVTLDRDPITGHILAAAPTPTGIAVAHESCPDLRPLPRQRADTRVAKSQR